MYKYYNWQFLFGSSRCGIKCKIQEYDFLLFFFFSFYYKILCASIVSGTIFIQVFFFCYMLLYNMETGWNGNLFFFTSFLIFSGNSSILKLYRFFFHPVKYVYKIKITLTHHVLEKIHLNISNLPIDFAEKAKDASNILIVLLAFFLKQLSHFVYLVVVVDILD